MSDTTGPTHASANLGQGRHSRLRISALALVAVLSLFFSALAPTTSSAATRNSDALLVSSGRRDARTLTGARISGVVHISAKRKKGLRKVAFYVDDPNMRRRPERIDRTRAYTLAGKRGFDTRDLADGRHTVTARFVPRRGRSYSVTAAFHVRNGRMSVGARAVSDALMYSSVATLNNASPLARALVSDVMHVFASRTKGLRKVLFYVDDPQMQRAPQRTDTTSPYTLSDHHGLDTREIGDGTHRVTAKFIPRRGRKYTVTAVFEVANGEPTPVPEPTPAPDPTPTVPADPTPAISVHTHGAVGDGVHDDTAAIRSALAEADRARLPVAFPGGTYRLTDGLDIPNGVSELRLHDKAVVRQEANDHAFRKQGTVTSAEYAIVSGADRGSRIIRMDHTRGLVVGDWLYIGSLDEIQTSKHYKVGFLRRITALNGTAVTLDKAFHRPMATEPKAWEVMLASPVTISGGVIENANPLTVFYPLVKLDLVRDPIIEDVELRNGGASGVRTIGTYGGVIDVDVHDLLDDHNGSRYGSGNHYGYGVEAAGATRGLQVRGTAYHVRHAFTTNGAYGAPDQRFRLMGEPEDVTVSMDVWETTSSGLDTHEPGYNIAFANCTVRKAGVYKREGSVDGKEGGFGIYIRARSTIVRDTVVESSAEDGLVVAAPGMGQTDWAVDDGPLLTGLQILNTEGKRGVHLKQPARLSSFTVRGYHQIGVHVSSDVLGARLHAGNIDLLNFLGSWGVLAPAGTEVTDIQVSGATKDRG